MRGLGITDITGIRGDSISSGLYSYLSIAVPAPGGATFTALRGLGTCAGLAEGREALDRRYDVYRLNGMLNIWILCSDLR